MSKRKKLKKTYRKKENKKIRRLQFTAFMIVLAVGFVVSLLLPLRPRFSESEKRELTPFPKFTIKTLCDGSFFDGISLWYSDTFPFREALVSANSKLQSMRGFGDRLYGLSDQKAEEIPDAPVILTEPAQDPFESIDDTLGGEISIDDNALVQNLGNVLLVGDAGYEVYNFNQNLANQYAAVINRAAKNLDGAAQVYDMLVPTSIDITLADKQRAKINSSSQADAIRYIYACLNDQVHSINVYNTLRAHRTEYVYFRTDHHWTALGAFYAYEQFCKALQLPAKTLNDFTEHQFPGFKGSFYTDTKKNAKLGDHPDTIYAYAPKGETTLTYHTKNGKTMDWHIISDVSGWNPTALYSTFIGGDNPYTYITNASCGNKKSCLVVKESFGNALVPFIAAEFAEVHVIDYRYWNGSVSQFVKEKSVDCVLFVNNLSATRNASLIKALSNISI